MRKEDLLRTTAAEPDPDLYAAVKNRWDHIAKPLDGMGLFEPLTCRIGAILGDEEINIGRKAVIVMCADNGIIEEGVSQSGSDVTANVAASMGRGASSICRMAAAAGADVIPVDIGMCCEKTPDGVLPKRVVNGTRNFAKEPAMGEEEVLAALEDGMDLVRQCKEQGYRILATGEMGIGNTTTSSAVAAALTGLDPEFLTGRGAGLDDAGLSRKKRVIREAMETYGLGRPGANPADSGMVGAAGAGSDGVEDIAAGVENVNIISPEETLRVLSCVGGADLAGLAGVFIGGAVCRIPVVLDGLVSAVAALAAERLVPGTKDYMIPSHLSREPAAEKVMELLDLEPVIRADLSLGEGTGAVMMFTLLDQALAVYGNAAAFADIRVEPYSRFE